AVWEQIAARRRDPCACREPLDGRVEERRLAERQLACADHPERCSVEHPIRAGREQERAENEDREKSHPAERPPDEGEDTCEPHHKEPGLDDVAGREEHYGSLTLVAAVFLPVVLEQAAGRPILVLGRVAAARAVERRDVLKGDED